MFRCQRLIARFTTPHAGIPHARFPISSFSSVSPTTEASFPVFSPRDGIQCNSLPDFTAEQVDECVARAVQCPVEWRNSAALPERQEVLRATAKRLRDPDTARAFSELESRDCGRPISETICDIALCADLFDYYSEIAPRIMGVAHSLEIPDKNFQARVHASGYPVVACVTPWNFPLLQAVVKIAPALVAGCAVLLKPSPLASLTSLRLRELMTGQGGEGDCHKGTGLPVSALQVITGGPPYSTRGGDRLISHPDIDFLSFTGSGRAGREMLRASAKELRPTALELGGKGAIIVLDDADLDLAIENILVGIFYGAGQVCSATSRLLVHSSLAPSLLPRLVTAAQALVVGDPLLPDTEMGPLVSHAQMKSVLDAIAAAQADGCTVLCGGAGSTSSVNLRGGYYVQPTILGNVPLTGDAWRKEIFGPVLCVAEFDTDEEAVSLTNDSEFGLGHAVFSKDAARANAIASRLDAGTVWVNCNGNLWPSTPFGGWKHSGFGCEFGEAGLREYLRHKTITQRVQ